MKIAFLFLTLDNVRFPQIWNEYFKNNESRINIYSHPKYPDKVTVSWQKKNIINNLATTNWGEIIYALASLFKAALQDKNNKKFIVVSESCLPIKSFDIFYKFLEKDHINTSYIDFWEMPEKDHNILKSKLPKNYFKYELKKHSAWFCLSRHHVKKLLITPEIYKFNKILVGDENFLTLLYNSNNIRDFTINYANWKYMKKDIKKINIKLKNLYQKKEDEMTNKYDSYIFELRKEKSILGKHPKTYEKITKAELKEMKKSESFFYRKFSVNSDIDQYYKELINS